MTSTNPNMAATVQPLVNQGNKKKATPIDRGRSRPKKK
jgi:hypothetical protein